MFLASCVETSTKNLTFPAIPKKIYLLPLKGLKNFNASVVNYFT